MRERAPAGLAEGGVGGLNRPQLNTCLLLPCQARLEDTNEMPQKVPRQQGLTGERAVGVAGGVPKLSKDQSGETGARIWEEGGRTRTGDQEDRLGRIHRLWDLRPPILPDLDTVHLWVGCKSSWPSLSPRRARLMTEGTSGHTGKL